eukprot:EG_transcript_2859
MEVATVARSAFADSTSVGPPGSKAAWNPSASQEFEAQVLMARSRASAVIFQGELFVFGGCGEVDSFCGNRFRNDSFRYDFHTESWSRLQCGGSFPKPRVLHSSVVRDGKLVIYGGLNEDGLFLNDMFALSLKEPYLWKKVAVHTSAMGPTPTPPFLCGHSAVIHPARRSMVLFGGRTTDGISSQTYEFLFATQELSRLGPPTRPTSRTGALGDVRDSHTPPPVFGHSAAIVHDTMYVFGGFTYAAGGKVAASNTVYAFDFRMQQWNVVFDPSTTPTTVPRNPMAFAFEKARLRIWALGEAETAYLPLTRDDGSATHWVPVAAKSQTKSGPASRDCAAVAVQDGRAVLYGGQRRTDRGGGHASPGRNPSPLEGGHQLDFQHQTFCNDLHAFDFVEERWSTLAEAPAPQTHLLGSAGTIGLFVQDHWKDPAASASLSPMAYQQKQHKDNQQIHLAATVPSRVIESQARFSKQYAQPLKRLRPELHDSRRKGSPPANGRSPVPLWKRDFRVPKPDQPPDMHLYYFGQAEARDGQRPRRIPVPGLSDARGRKPSPGKAGTANRSRSPPKRPPESSLLLTSVQSEDLSGSICPVPRHHLYSGPELSVAHPQSLQALLATADSADILKTLMDEQYQFREQKGALAASGAAVGEEGLAYEQLLDTVIQEYLAHADPATLARLDPTHRLAREQAEQARQPAEEPSEPETEGDEPMDLAPNGHIVPSQETEDVFDPESDLEDEAQLPIEIEAADGATALPPAGPDGTWSDDDDRLFAAVVPHRGSTAAETDTEPEPPPESTASLRPLSSASQRQPMAAVDRDASIEDPPDATPDNFSHAEEPPPPEAEAAVVPAAEAELEVEAMEEARWAEPHSNEQGAADPTATEAA